MKNISALLFALIAIRYGFPLPPQGFSTGAKMIDTGGREKSRAAQIMPPLR
jgi:hypothetical protein